MVGFWVVVFGVDVGVVMEYVVFFVDYECEFVVGF